MGILAECPICRRRQSLRKKICLCGEDLDKAKRSKRVRYWINYRFHGGKQRRELVGFSISEARDADGKRRAEKREGKLFEIKPDIKMTFKGLSDWYLGLEKVRNLSGGQQQSVSIARTMFFEAKIVILDEPTSAISVKETQRVLDLILQLKEEDIAVIIVSHRMEDIFRVSDRIVVLRRGSKVEDIPRQNTTATHIIQKIIGGDHE